jgi:two-component SAPR family response regulator
VKQSKDQYIHINNDWALHGDERHITLYKKHLTEKGTIYYDAKGYFQDYIYALQRMIDMDIGPLNNIQYICERIDQLRNDIETMIKHGPGPLS